MSSLSNSELEERLKASLKVVTCSDNDGTRKTKRVNHLMKISSIWAAREKIDEAVDDLTFLRLQEVFLCLRIPLIHDSQVVRASALRTIRLLTEKDYHVQLLSTLNLHHLIVRSIDLDLDNNLERIQALKLMRKCIFVGHREIAPAFARALVSLVEGGVASKDRLYKAALATLCELCVLNPFVFIAANGTMALVRSLLDCSVPRITEAVVDCLLFLHNNPKTR